VQLKAGRMNGRYTLVGREQMEESSTGSQEQDRGHGLTPSADTLFAWLAAEYQMKVT